MGYPELCQAYSTGCSCTYSPAHTGIPLQETLAQFGLQELCADGFEE